MVKPGPKARPASVSVLHGETRPSRVNYDAPKPAEGEPRCPSWADRRTKAVWRQVAAQLRAMKLLHLADYGALLVYCEAIAKYEEATKLVDEQGLLVKGRDGNTVKNPAVQVMRDYAAVIHKMGAEFGLTPSSRTQFHSEKQGNGQGAGRLLTG